MNAVDYFKKHGFEDCEWICNVLFLGLDGGNFEYNNDIVDVDDLKHIVASHKLVESRGGLRLAVNFRNSDKFKSLNRESQCRLNQAIIDMELCQ